MLVVASAAKLRVRFAVTVKSPDGVDGSVATVTVNGVSDAGDTVAVTVLVPPCSLMESGDRASETAGAALLSVIHTETTSPSDQLRLVPSQTKASAVWLASLNG